MCHLVRRPIHVTLTIAIDLQYVVPAAFGWYNINFFAYVIDSIHTYVELHGRSHKVVGYS